MPAAGRHAWTPGEATESAVWFESLKDAAKEFHSYFEIAQRADNTSFIRLREGSPDWAVQIVRQAHGDMMPDDYRFEYAMIAAEMLWNYDDPDDVELQPDVYTSDLLDWLRSRNDRTTYIDDAIRDYGKAEQFDQDMMIAQTLEREEVLGSVRGSLEDMLI